MLLLFDWFRPASRQAATRRPGARSRLALESLEDRAVPASFSEVDHLRPPPPRLPPDPPIPDSVLVGDGNTRGDLATMTPQPVGLLVPAVQKVREETESPPASGGDRETASGQGEGISQDLLFADQTEVVAALYARKAGARNDA